MFPTTRESPSGAQARLNASPRPLISLKHVFERTSQSLRTPSLLTLASSVSFTGLNATFSIGAKWPFRSVENFAYGFSGFPAEMEVVILSGGRCHCHFMEKVPSHVRGGRHHQEKEGKVSST